MGAPKGNQFWKLAASIGRNKIFSSPENLKASCAEYFETTDKRKWAKKDFIRSGEGAGTVVDLPTDTPYTQSGICLFLGIDEKTWWNYGNDQNYKDFFPIVAWANQIIETQQREGALVGAFNAPLIARMHNLADKQEITGNQVKITIKKK